MVRGAKITCMAVLGLALSATAQPLQGATGTAPAASAPAAAPDIAPTLSRLEHASQATVAALGEMRVDRWKTSAADKRDAEHNAQSLVRNLNFALPGLISAARSAPDSTAATFKLYRNLEAIYDVMSGLVESAGAFGSDTEYNRLGEQLKVFDDSRAVLANRIEQRTAQQEAEIAHLRDSLRAATQPPPQATEPAKKIVVTNGADQTAASKKKKKKSAPAPKPASTTPPGSN